MLGFFSKRGCWELFGHTNCFINIFDYIWKCHVSLMLFLPFQCWWCELQWPQDHISVQFASRAVPDFKTCNTRQYQLQSHTTPAVVQEYVWWGVQTHAAAVGWLWTVAGPPGEAGRDARTQVWRLIPISQGCKNNSKSFPPVLYD